MLSRRLLGWHRVLFDANPTKLTHRPVELNGHIALSESETEELDRFPIPDMGAIVLCGGQSSRMGIDKFSLPFAEKTILDCVIDRLSVAVAGPIVVVGNESNFTALEKVVANHRHVICLADEFENRGPLEGIRVGLEKLASQTEWAFATCCDVPMLQKEILTLLRSRVSETSVEAVMPIDGERIYGMTAIYRTTDKPLKVINELIQKSELRVSGLAQALKTQFISLDEIREVDPKLWSLLNLNHPQQYFDFLREHGETCPGHIEKLLKRLPSDG